MIFCKDESRWNPPSHKLIYINIYIYSYTYLYWVSSWIPGRLTRNQDLVRNVMCYDVWKQGCVCVWFFGSSSVLLMMTHKFKVTPKFCHSVPCRPAVPTRLGGRSTPQTALERTCQGPPPHTFIFSFFSSWSSFSRNIPRRHSRSPRSPAAGDSDGGATGQGVGRWWEGGPDAGDPASPSEPAVSPRSDVGRFRSWFSCVTFTF